MYHNFLIHSSADERLGCFHVLAIVNSAAIKNEVPSHTSLQTINAGEGVEKREPSDTVGESEVAQLYPAVCDPWTVAHQAFPSMGFSRQEYWSGLPFPSPVGKNAN